MEVEGVRITPADIRSFNNGVEPSFNEEYNRQNKIYSRSVYDVLIRVRSWAFGIFPEPIAMKHVRNYVQNRV